jgi:hypothetical protein
MIPALVMQLAGGSVVPDADFAAQEGRHMVAEGHDLVVIAAFVMLFAARFRPAAFLVPVTMLAPFAAFARA